MKKFEEKTLENLETIQAGIGGVQNDWKISARVGKDEWNCWEVKVDFDVKVSK